MRCDAISSLSHVIMLIHMKLCTYRYWQGISQQSYYIFRLYESSSATCIYSEDSHCKFEF